MNIRRGDDLIKSEYRKAVIKLINYYWCLPFSDNAIEMLVMLYPQLQSAKKFRKTCMHMKDDGFLKRERAFIEKGAKKDCIMLDALGKKEYLKISNDLKNSQHANPRKNELEKRKTQFRMNETEIFFLIGTKKIRELTLSISQKI